jgi:Secretion system C-terminal sorting domain
MKKIYAVVILFAFLAYQPVSAQCPTPTGMVGVPLTLGGNCFMNVQFAIPNSNVSIYNASGYVAQGTANGSGNAVIAYPCASNPITSIVSIVTSPSIQICNTSIITNTLIVLPVKLVSFTGVITARKTVQLKWETSLEVLNDRYEVERSIDGINYTKISTVTSSGDGLGSRKYAFEDISFATNAAAFYRLKQIDYDGKVSYSKIVYLNDKSSASGSYTLFPNPINSGNTVQIKGIAANEVNAANIQVSDIGGRIIPFKTTGSNTIELDAALANGIYFIKVKNTTLRLVKN